ncbi:GntR family transcriptional regulator [Pseudomonas sp. NPDC089918]|uniref:GntR family transcriptional regulator n=1 Tax=Pseudomonas sp. NPDC089918 TaxID=3390654 RepID=UPI003D060B01
MAVIEKFSAFEQAVLTLEEEIVLGFLHPGQRLVEDELLARFGLKRHVIRQVLVELERMGLVERKRNIGAVVRSYSAKEVTDLYAVRMLLEAECARLIVFPVPEQAMEQLKQIQKAHDTSVQRCDLRSAFRANMRFHRQVFSLSDNQILVDAIQHHAQRCHSIRSYSLVFPEQMERARQEHWDIIEAISVGDTERLVELCSAHLIPARDIYLRLYHQRTKMIG